MSENDELLKKIIEIGISLSSIHDIEKLLDQILLESRRIARADSGSIYLVEGDRLNFKISQNDTLVRRWGQERFNRSFSVFSMEISERSMAGYVVLHGDLLKIDDVQNLPPGSPYRYNASFDRHNDYVTRSMISIPLKNKSNQVIGVLQLINAMENGEVVSFNPAYESILTSLASQAAVALENVILQDRIREAHLDTIVRLGIAAEFRDKETSSHIKRVSLYCELLARHLGWDRKRIEVIRFATPMHDVGKVGIPDSILHKPGPFNPEERRIMEYHTVIGAMILKYSNDELIRASRVVALTHHEKWDGTGYPRRLAGEEIPVEGRIAALADVFDALSTKRVYKEAFSEDKTCRIIRSERGKLFDPELVDIFFDNYPEFLAIRQQFSDQEHELDFFRSVDQIDLEELARY
ncbi:MAG: HD domain-containing protein [Candidatus Delongbacteria bacterium]|nr:HD domain-containing protein [Candidatus Delongbacteria bacterium]